MSIEESYVDETQLSGPARARSRRWSTPGCPFSIEYAPELLTGLRRRAVEAALSLPHGGLEIGGVLFGRVSPNARAPLKLELVAERPIECAHASGPAFVLSDKDLAGVTAQLERTRVEPELSALSVAGFWISHSRGALDLEPEDLDVYNRAFPNGWQIALVLKPQAGGMTRAGFFYRKGGRVAEHDRGSEFLTDAPDEVAERSSADVMADEGSSDNPTSDGATPDDAALEHAAPSNKTGRPVEPWVLEARAMEIRAIEARALEGRSLADIRDDYPRSRGLTLNRVAALLALFLALGGAAGYYLREMESPRAAAVARVQGVVQPAGQPDAQVEGFLLARAGMLVRWNARTPMVAAAQSGMLTVREGGTSRAFALDSAALRRGYFRVATRGTAARVTLQVSAADGSSQTWEASAVAAGEAFRSVDIGRRPL